MGFLASSVAGKKELGYGSLWACFCQGCSGAAGLSSGLPRADLSPPPPPGVWAASLLRGGGPGLLPLGWPYPVQELQCAADPGTLLQDHHGLLIGGREESARRFPLCSCLLPGYAAAVPSAHLLLRGVP